MRLKTLTYTSRARLDMSDDELNDIQRSARSLNAIDGITGLLLFDGVRFLQLIEGSEDAVDNLAERLRRDRRHSDFEVRDERFSDARSFPDWSMNLVRVGSGFTGVQVALAPLLPDDTTPAVRELLYRMTDAMAA
jgi:hypothetical protein